MTEESPSGRDTGAVARVIERFASALAEAGFPRMPARVFVGLLATDSGRLTAAEMAELLQVSPAAISGAVRYLTQVNLASREREPGSRRDLYQVHHDVWYEAIAHRDQMLAKWTTLLQDAVHALGEHTDAGARMAETRDFFLFMNEELPKLVVRWHERKDELRRQRAATAR